MAGSLPQLQVGRPDFRSRSSAASIIDRRVEIDIVECIVELSAELKRYPFTDPSVFDRGQVSVLRAVGPAGTQDGFLKPWAR